MFEVHLPPSELLTHLSQLRHVLLFVDDDVTLSTDCTCDYKLYSKTKPENVVFYE